MRITSLVDNVYDALLADDERTGRARFGVGTATAPQFEEGRTAVGLVAEHGFSALVTVGGLIGGLHLSGPAFEPVIAPTVNSPPDAVDRSDVRSGTARSSG